MSTSGMGRFWDERAREDALYFIDTRRGFRDPDLGSFWASGEEDLDRLLDTLGAGVEPTDAALDIGCGAGRLTRALARRARTVVGIDVSQEMIARARQLNGDLDNVSWVHGNGLDLQPLEDASVDLVVSLVVFQHIPDPNITLGYIRDIGRVLRPGGRAAIHVSNDPTVHRVPGDGLGVRERIMRLAGRSPRGREHSAWLGSAVELDQVASTAEAAGMTVAHVVGAGTQYCGLLLRRDSMGSER